MSEQWYDWINVDVFLPPKSYVCGYCAENISSGQGYRRTIYYFDDDEVRRVIYEFIYLCHKCQRPTFFDRSGDQFPGGVFGSNVESLPDDVRKLYFEARVCLGGNLATAAVLCSRKLLMHIAVDKGAKENKTFRYYVEYFSEAGILPASNEIWIDVIRDKGNDANHEIKMMDIDDGEKLLNFLEMLLKLIYEFPAKAGVNRAG